VGTLRVAAPPEALPVLESARLDLQGVTRAQEVRLEAAPAGSPLVVEVTPHESRAVAER
jgi:hypothetical protein